MAAARKAQSLVASVIYGRRRRAKTRYGLCQLKRARRVDAGSGATPHPRPPPPVLITTVLISCGARRRHVQMRRQTAGHAERPRDGCRTCAVLTSRSRDQQVRQRYCIDELSPTSSIIVPQLSREKRENSVRHRRLTTLKDRPMADFVYRMIPKPVQQGKET